MSMLMKNKEVFLILKNYLFLLLLAIPVVLFSAVSSTENIVYNSSFENLENGKPASWDLSIWVPDDRVFQLDTNNAHNGQKSVLIINRKENDSKLFQVLSIKKNTLYRIRCWAMTEDVGMGAKGANISIEGSLTTSIDLKGTVRKWTQLELYLENTDFDNVKIVLGLGGLSSMNTGRAWFDDVVVEAATNIPPNAIVIDYRKATHDKGLSENTPARIVLISLSVIIVLFLIGLAWKLLSAKKSSSKRNRKKKKKISDQEKDKPVFITSELLGAREKIEKVKLKKRKY